MEKEIKKEVAQTFKVLKTTTTDRKYNVGETISLSNKEVINNLLTSKNIK